MELVCGAHRNNEESNVNRLAFRPEREPQIVIKTAAHQTQSQPALALNSSQYQQHMQHAKKKLDFSRITSSEPVDDQENQSAVNNQPAQNQTNSQAVVPASAKQSQAIKRVKKVKVLVNSSSGALANLPNQAQQIKTTKQSQPKQPQPAE